MQSMQVTRMQSWRKTTAAPVATTTGRVVHTTSPSPYSPAVMYTGTEYSLLGASEITANLYCNCVYLYWVRDLQYIFAIIYGTLSMIAGLGQLYPTIHLGGLLYYYCNDLPMDMV